MAGEVVIPGETIIEDDVVASIAGIAAMEVEGVAIHDAPGQRAVAEVRPAVKRGGRRSG